MSSSCSAVVVVHSSYVRANVGHEVYDLIMHSPTAVHAMYARVTVAPAYCDDDCRHHYCSTTTKKKRRSPAMTDVPLPRKTQPPSSSLQRHWSPRATTFVSSLRSVARFAVPLFIIFVRTTTTNNDKIVGSNIWRSL